MDPLVMGHGGTLYLPIMRKYRVYKIVHCSHLRKGEREARAVGLVFLYTV
jgi:hypothetical protein